jgi:(R)-2-hydroxyacyl-CoA dehydratese activating ATPase
MYFAGIDIGSTMTKVVLVDGKGLTVSVVKGPTGPEHRRLADEVMRQALNFAGVNLQDVLYVVSTGYGRVNVPFADRQITELTCHSRGVFSLFPNVRTAIDIGGQDAKAMKIRAGKLVDFAMNDKCAAGTGRFLEIMAATLGISLEEMGALAARATKKIAMSSLCTIFAQQEVISSLSDGAPVEDILSGLNEALVTRVAALAQRMRIEPDVVLTGGVAKNQGIVKAMKDVLKCEILVPEDPILTGALGAALLARDDYLKEADREMPPGKERRLEKATFFK